MRKKLYFFLYAIIFWFQSLNSNLDKIHSLDFSPACTERIMKEIGAILENPRKTALDFSNLDAPHHVNNLLKILFIYLYPGAICRRLIKSKDHLSVHIKHINLSGNSLESVPKYAELFPEVETMDCTGNCFPEWVRINMSRTRNKIDITI